MRFSLQREALLKPLAQVVNVVERRQTLPVLANLYLKVEPGSISLTGTDLEVEMIAKAEAQDTESGETTIPARKFFDIVRALPDGSKVTVSQSGVTAQIRQTCDSKFVFVMNFNNTPVELEFDRPRTDMLTGEIVNGSKTLPAYGVLVL